MKQVLQNRGGVTVVRNVRAPSCSPAGVLVKSAFSAISSGTERSRLEPRRRSLVARARERPDAVRQTLDMALRDGVRITQERIRDKLSEESPAGYSSVGRVIEVGPRVRELQPGDMVACAGVGHANHAEVVSVPANLCARVPEAVPLRAAALTTIAAIALHAIRVSDVRLDDRVAVSASASSDRSSADSLVAPARTSMRSTSTPDASAMRSRAAPITGSRRARTRVGTSGR